MDAHFGGLINLTEVLELVLLNAWLILEVLMNIETLQRPSEKILESQHFRHIPWVSLIAVTSYNGDCFGCPLW